MHPGWRGRHNRQALGEHRRVAVGLGRLHVVDAIGQAGQIERHVGGAAVLQEDRRVVDHGVIRPQQLEGSAVVELGAVDFDGRLARPDDAGRHGLDRERHQRRRNRIVLVRGRDRAVGQNVVRAGLGDGYGDLLVGGGAAKAIVVLPSRRRLSEADVQLVQRAGRRRIEVHLQRLTGIDSDLVERRLAIAERPVAGRAQRQRRHVDGGLGNRDASGCSRA